VRGRIVNFPLEFLNGEDELISFSKGVAGIADALMHVKIMFT
jgi:hypothetical protein